VGLHGDEKLVFGVESDGKVMAWQRADGQLAWSSEQLRHRGISTPLAVGRSVVVGDASGLVHWLSREDGALLNRMATDGSAVVSGPVLAEGTLVVVTRQGGIFGFKPE
jgi:outer membrane protein assembly factor BamB